VLQQKYAALETRLKQNVDQQLGTMYRTSMSEDMAGVNRLKHVTSPQRAPSVDDFDGVERMASELRKVPLLPRLYRA
jgi:hypothetical protein